MKIAVVSIGSFDTQYSDYHIMRDIIVGLLERGHDVDLIQKQYLDIPRYPKTFEKYLNNQLRVHSIPFEKKARADLKARYLADLSLFLCACIKPYSRFRFRYSHWYLWIFLDLRHDCIGVIHSCRLLASAPQS